jgi:MFS family permease
VSQSLVALAGLNFFMADVRDGLGPFLGIFLLQNGWGPGAIGLVASIAGLAAMALTTPLGMLADASRARRLLLAFAALVITLACAANWFMPSFPVTAGAQVLTAIAGAAVTPLVAAITLGLVGQAGYARQLGRNAAFRHAGTATAAMLSGLLGYRYGIGAVFLLMGVMALGGILAVALIRGRDIDHDAARGAVAGHGPPKGLLAVLRDSPPLLVLGATVLLFHLANAAMLPLLGQAMVARGTAGDGSAYTAATVVIAQGTMIVMALFAAWLAQKRGYGIVFVIALAALPIRGLIAGFVTDPAVLVPVQILDGVGAGMMGVAVPGLVARLLDGTGRANAGLAAVLTAQAIGASLSNGLGGFVAQHIGFSAAFLALAGVATLALLLWLVAWMKLRGVVALGRPAAAAAE